jgi:hypothetical protein
VRSSHQRIPEASLSGSAELGERLHVPHVIATGVHSLLGGEHVEGRDLEVGDVVHRPAVSPVGVDVLLDRLRPRLETTEQLCTAAAALRRLR